MKEHFRKFKTLILPIMLVAVGLILIVDQPDFGSSVVITMITMGMLFLAGFPWEYLTVLVTTVMSGVGLLILATPYRMACMATLLDPQSDPLGKNYQLTCSLMATARGD